jgi:hypothetical protein
MLPDRSGHGKDVRRMLMTLTLIALMILVILALLETWMYGLVHYPAVLRRCSRKLQNSISYLYIQGDRKIMQFQEGSGQYHPDLGYTLKPGKFVFTETEFSNEYHINSLGVRDAEASLNAPEIVFLGDSFALGWGVDQGQTFVKLLEDRTHYKTLNTSVPSYGTIREMLMLRKVDRSRLKCLIIQYCGDDYDENRLYYKNGNRPQIMRAETFQKLTTLHSKAKSYYPGKYIGLKIRKKYGEWIAKHPPSDDDHSLSHVDLFLHALKQNADMLVGLPIIVFEINGINQSNTFTLELREKKSNPDEPPLIRNLIVLDMTEYLDDRHFYVLDGHLNAEGHRIVAHVLYEILSLSGLL